MKQKMKQKAEPAHACLFLRTCMANAGIGMSLVLRPAQEDSTRLIAPL